MTTEKLQLIEKLLNQSEGVMRRQLRTPLDFDFASELIERRTKIRLSRTTLMRLWGYVREPVEPRETTLTTIAQFCGYENWNHFVTSGSECAPIQSDPVLSCGIEVERDLTAGEVLLLSWQPGREMAVRYDGDCRFTVLRSEMTRLAEGTTFRCFLIIEDEPLFLSEVNIGGTNMPAYVCGRNTGVKIKREE